MPQLTSWRVEGQSSSARGYGYRWQQARIRFLEQHPLCVMCDGRGQITAATVVDHIDPHRGDQAKFWNVSNWQALCASCHSSIKQAQEAASAGGCVESPKPPLL